LDERACRRCGSEKTIKAHIIPRAFARHAKGSEKALSAIDVEGGEQFSQSGFWDQNILCESCDGKLGVFDGYFIEFCRSLRGVESLPGGPRVFENVDAIKVAKFANSVVWRASISKRKECSEIDLQSKEKGVADSIFDDGAAPILPVVVIRYASKETDLFSFYTNPYIQDLHESKVVTFSVGGFRIQVHVGGGPLPNALERFAIKGSSELQMAVVQLEKTNEYKGMLEMVRKNLAVDRKNALRTSDGQQSSEHHD